MADWQRGETIAGPYLLARNSASTGIHSDAFAQSQGFKRAVVAGPNHLTFAGSVLEEQLGRRWLEQGRLRVRFTAPVYDGDLVRAVFMVNGEGDSFSAEFVLENADAAVVAAGSASWSPELGTPPDAPAPSSPEAELLELRALAIGERIPVQSVTASAEAVDRFCRLNHDPFARPARVPASFLSPLLFGPARAFMNDRKVGPGMWGEIDVCQYRPLRTDLPYRYEGTVRSRRRRGNLEVVDFAFEAREQDGSLVCAILHTHLIPHRNRSG